MKRKVERTLIDMGIYPNLLGFDYICRAIEYIQADRRAKICDVYGLIAGDYDTTPQRVERAIRHALSNKADKNSEAYKKYAGIKDTTNSAVLYTMAVRLRED